MESATQIYERALVLFKERNFTAIDGLLSVQILRKQNNASLYLLRAHLESAYKNDEGAIDYMTTAISIDPANPLLYRQRGHFFASMGSPDKAFADYSKALTLQPDWAALYFDRGVVLREMGEANKAMEDYDKCIELNAAYHKAYFNRGMLSFEKRDFEKALIDFDKILDVDNNAAAGYFGKGKVWISLGEFDQALRDLNKAIELEDKAPEFYISRGVAWFHTGDMDKALADYNVSQQLDPENPSSYINRGLLWVRQQKHFDAIADFTKAVLLRPGDPEALLHRGNVFFNIRDFQKALHDFEAVQRVSGDFQKDIYSRIELARRNLEFHEGLFSADSGKVKVNFNDYKYSKERPSSFPMHYMERYYQLLVDYFGDAWLNATGNHPLQVLWKRKDEMANDELFSFSKCLEIVAKIDSKWIEDQVGKAKSGVDNTRIGAIREILVLGYMHSKSHPIIPAKKNQKGFDGTLKLGEKKQLRISIKSYGMTTKHKEFEEKAEAVKHFVLHLVSKYKLYPVNVLIESPFIYPEEWHWRSLRGRLEMLFQQFKAGQLQHQELFHPSDGITLWSIRLVPIPDSAKRLHPNWSSSTIHISAKYHKNEFKNLVSKVEEACSDFRKHLADESEAIINGLFVSIPKTVSIQDCHDHLLAYLNERPELPVSWIFLYKAQINGYPGTGKISLEHCVLQIRRGFMDKWNDNKKPVILVVPTGVVTNKQTSFHHFFRNEKGEDFGHQEFSDRYIYQYGELYYKESYPEMIGLLSDGIHANCVARNKDGSWTVKKPLMAQREQLLIL